MDWIRENKPLAVIFGIIIAASLGLGYLLFDSWTKYTESKEAYITLSNEVAGMKGARLAPTEANVKAKQAMVEEFASNVNKLGSTLLILQAVPPPTKNIEFQSKLKAKVADVRKAAASFKMALPAEFAFGFDEYTANLPAETASTELSGYLDAMDELVKLFMNSGVESVDSLERSKLPVEGGKPATASTPQQQTGPVSRIAEKSQISATLTLDQGALQLLIARLANPSEMPYFTSLRLLRIENQRQEGPVRAGASASADPIIPLPAADAAKPAAAASNEIKPPDPAPTDSVPLIGQEKLKVRMEIDLIKFLEPARGVAQQAAPAPRR